MPDAIPHAESIEAQAIQASAGIKYEGKPGEKLEADLFYFELRSLRLCDSSGRLAGVELEIEAKSRFSVSPRDVVIGRGGLAFTGSLDFERKPPGCTPLLRVSTLKKGERARGFVLFDLPRVPTDGLVLIYQPTRWGGAGYVRTLLEDWPSPR